MSKKGVKAKAKTFSSVKKEDIKSTNDQEKLEIEQELNNTTEILINDNQKLPTINSVETPKDHFQTMDSPKSVNYGNNFSLAHCTTDQFLQMIQNRFQENLSPWEKNCGVSSNLLPNLHDTNSDMFKTFISKNDSRRPQNGNDKFNNTFEYYRPEMKNNSFDPKLKTFSIRVGADSCNIDKNSMFKHLKRSRNIKNEEEMKKVVIENTKKNGRNIFRNNFDFKPNITTTSDNFRNDIKSTSADINTLTSTKILDLESTVINNLRVQDPREFSIIKLGKLQKDTNRNLNATTGTNKYVKFAHKFFDKSFFQNFKASIQKYFF